MRTGGLSFLKGAFGESFRGIIKDLPALGAKRVMRPVQSAAINLYHRVDGLPLSAYPVSFRNHGFLETNS